MKTSMLHTAWGRFAAMAAALASLLALSASAALVPASVTTTGSKSTESRTAWAYSTSACMNSIMQTMKV